MHTFIRLHAYPFINFFIHTYVCLHIYWAWPKAISTFCDMLHLCVNFVFANFLLNFLLCICIVKTEKKKDRQQNIAKKATTTAHTRNTRNDNNFCQQHDNMVANKTLAYKGKIVSEKTAIGQIQSLAGEGNCIEKEGSRCEWVGVVCLFFTFFLFHFIVRNFCWLQSSRAVHIYICIYYAHTDACRHYANTPFLWPFCKEKCNCIHIHTLVCTILQKKKKNRNCFSSHL